MAQPAVALLCVAVFLQDVGKGRGVLCLHPGEGTWGKRPAGVPVLEDFGDDSPLRRKWVQREAVPYQGHTGAE